MLTHEMCRIGRYGTLFLERFNLGKFYFMQLKLHLMTRSFHARSAFHYKEKNIENFFNACIKVFEGKIGEFEFIFINDGSKDNTWLELNRLYEEKTAANIKLIIVLLNALCYNESK